MNSGTKKLTTIFATVAFAAVLTVAVQRLVLVGQLLPTPVPKARVAAIKEAAHKMPRHGTGYGNLNNVPSGLYEVLIDAADLARTGNPDAEYLAGWMYESRWLLPTVVTGVPSDWKSTSLSTVIYDLPTKIEIDSRDELYRKLSASWTNCPFDVSNLVHCRTDQDHHFESAVHWYKLAAEHGSVPAAAELGYMYQCGWCSWGAGADVPIDYGRSLEWYQRAAAAGDAQAKIDLGWMYEHGKGNQARSQPSDGAL